jgi:hypothetical protein
MTESRRLRFTAANREYSFEVADGPTGSWRPREDTVPTETAALRQSFAALR